MNIISPFAHFNEACEAEELGSTNFIANNIGEGKQQWTDDDCLKHICTFEDYLDVKLE